MNSKRFFTLITGASQGIGKALAFECAKRGMNLFLVALSNRYLEETEHEIKSAFDISVISLGIDLTDDEAPQKVYEYALSNQMDINILINNAGFGTSGLFENSDHSINARMVKLNNLAFVGITHYFLDQLKKNHPSYILNMSSMEANLPLPYKAVYTGTKNFIYAFTLALKEELRHTGIHVSVVCPGPVVTNEDGMKRIKSQGSKAKLLVKMPDEVAAHALNGLLNKKTVIIPGFIPRLISFIACLLPRNVKMRALERIFRAYRDHKPDPKVYIS